MGKFNEQQLRETLCFPHVNALKKCFLRLDSLSIPIAVITRTYFSAEYKATNSRIDLSNGCGEMKTLFLTPKFQTFDDKKILQNIMKDILLYRDMECQTFWPIKAMMEILSPDFFRYFNKEKKWLT